MFKIRGALPAGHCCVPRAGKERQWGLQPTSDLHSCPEAAQHSLLPQRRFWQIRQCSARYRTPKISPTTMSGSRVHIGNENRNISSADLSLGCRYLPFSATSLNPTSGPYKRFSLADLLVIHPLLDSWFAAYLSCSLMGAAGSRLYTIPSSELTFLPIFFAGLVVDTKVVHPADFSFFLNSHAGLQVISKPVTHVLPLLSQMVNQTIVRSREAI